MRNKNVILEASLFSQRAQGSAKVAQSYSWNMREVGDDLKSDATRKHEEDATGYRREAVGEKADSEADDIEDKEIEEALQWLGAEWESLAKILRQRDSEIDWEDDY